MFWTIRAGLYIGVETIRASLNGHEPGHSRLRKIPDQAEGPPFSGLYAQDYTSVWPSLVPGRCRENCLTHVRDPTIGVLPHQSSEQYPACRAEKLAS